MTKGPTFREFAEIRNGAWPWHDGCGVAEAHHMLAETVADWCDFQSCQPGASPPPDARDWLQARKQEGK